MCMCVSERERARKNEGSIIIDYVKVCIYVAVVVASMARSNKKNIHTFL